ncbi:MAG: glycine cleavage system aminomethyltransferase GcvT [Rhodospirillales bacterium]|nr:glycine cleavage system aminomethyltransferase GcvT [Rhodospirillales bacterium]
MDALHRSLGARMVPFAGYAMPVQYTAGIIAEHNQTRNSAALFDVSHMGQAKLFGHGAAAALERLVPGDIAGLKPFRQRYTLLTTESGTIIDDLMVATLPDALFLVVNASRKAVDFAHIAANLPAGVTLAPMPDRALIALQGPQAAAVMARLAPDVAALAFMGVADTRIAGHACLVSRSGYTGEDGFEISVAATAAEALARALLAQPEVAPAGLGARDSLRLEAGLCLWGNDIDESTNAIEAGLAWTIGKRRRAGWDFSGGPALRDILAAGPRRERVGILPEGRAPARAGTEILAAGQKIGTVTSGGFGPTLGAPLAMGYVDAAHAAIGTALMLSVRGQALPARVAAMPFVPHRYIR